MRNLSTIALAALLLVTTEAQAGPTKGRPLKTGQGTTYGAAGDTTAGLSRMYNDLGNGVIKDQRTGLFWEKKSDDGSIHDWDNAYSWSTGSPWNFDGTAATVFLATLNTVPCFAGFCDWRLPTIDELSGRSDGGIATGGIVDLTVPGCTGGGSPRINAIFGPTRCSYYWSSAETISSGPNVAWSVDFYNGNVVIYGKTYDIFVRAVRSGS